MQNYLFLFIAIVGELIGTSMLKNSAGFTRLWPSLLAVAGYSLAFYFLSLAIRSIPIGVAYAIWAGVGIALVALIGLVLFGQKLNFPTIAGLMMIVAGVITVNLASSGNPH